MIATQRGLGVNRPSASYLFSVIASPAASYFRDGIHPVTVWLSEEYTRAAPGGTGEAKCGGNYAASFAGQQQAVARGCDKVGWLDAAGDRLVEEMGGGRRDARPGDHAAARGTARHPVRPPARPLRLGAQARLTDSFVVVVATTAKNVVVLATTTISEGVAGLRG